MKLLEYSDTPKFTNALRKFCVTANAMGDVSKVVSEVLAQVHAGGTRPCWSAPRNLTVPA